MSGIKLEEILKSINICEEVIIESEFSVIYAQKKPKEFLSTLNKSQLSTEFDYMRTINGIITIGISAEIFSSLFN